MPHPYEPRDQAEFARLQVHQIAPHDTIFLKDGSMWQVVRMLATRDARGNLRYAAMNQEGDGQTFVIINIMKVVQPDIRPVTTPVESTPVDFEFRNDGTVWIIWALSPRAKAWLDEHVATEPWQWLGDGLVVDHRYAAGLRDAILEHGFIIAPRV